MSDFDLEGRERPGAVVVFEEELERREVRVEVKAREEEVEISFGAVLGLWCG